ncbi:MAG: hypothetical protein FJ291_11235 [Planctomycetes bacterium]|nr:hypothetical protein [Planctomycetota bacterium]
MRSVLMGLAVGVWLAALALGEEKPGDKRPPHVAKPAIATEVKPADQPDADKAVSGLLKTKKVTFDFVDTPVADAMEFMRQLVGVNMVLAPEVDRQATLTLKGNDMLVGQALQWMARLVGAKMEVKDGAVVVQLAKEGEQDFPPKAKPDKGFGKFDPDKFRKHGLAPLGKATIPLGNGASVELNLEEEDLDPDTRRVLLKLLQKQLLSELEKQDPKAAAEFREAAEKRAKKEAEEGPRNPAEEHLRLRDKLRDKFHKLLKPEKGEPRAEENKGQF